MSVQICLRPWRVWSVGLRVTQRSSSQMYPERSAGAYAINRRMKAGMRKAMATMDVTAMFVKQARILGSRLGTMEDALAAIRHFDSGRFQPMVGEVLPLEEISHGHRMLERGDVAGKIVVRL